MADAICAGVAARAQLHRRACELSVGRHGVEPIIQVTAPEAEGTFWSALERAFGAGVAASGLPRPRYNHPLRIDGRLLMVDALFPAAVVVELHGLAFHARPAARQSDSERLNLLTLGGYRPLVFTWWDVHHAWHEVERRLQRAVTARRAGLRALDG